MKLLKSFFPPPPPFFVRADNGGGPGRGGAHSRAAAIEWSSPSTLLQKLPVQFGLEATDGDGERPRSLHRHQSTSRRKTPADGRTDGRERLIDSPRASPFHRLPSVPPPAVLFLFPQSPRSHVKRESRTDVRSKVRKKTKYISEVLKCRERGGMMCCC